MMGARSSAKIETLVADAAEFIVIAVRLQNIS